MYADASNERKAEPSPEPNPSFIHPTAVVHPDAIIGQVSLFSSIGTSVSILESSLIFLILEGVETFLTTQGVSVGPFCTVGSSAKIGNGCKLHPSSHVFGDTKLGERCVLMT